MPSPRRPIPRRNVSVVIDIRQLDSSDKNFDTELTELLNRSADFDPVIETTVRKIINRIRKDGDAALLDYTRDLDQLDVHTVAELEMPIERLQQALDAIDKKTRDALRTAAERIRKFHEKQLEQSWEFSEADGNRFGQRLTPLDKVGLYVPGGKAAYPSSVLMTAIPAKVANVGELIMMVPTPKGVVNEVVLAASAIAGVDRVFTIGGAQAISALAYGTETVPGVDKIVGPGNAYVATAKRLVFGQVGIDMIAGPSEVAVLCDNTADPHWVAMDLFAQAEHDESAQSILISPDADFIIRTQQAMNELLPQMERQSVIKASLAQHGALIKVSNVDDGINVANRIAPEHLELIVENGEQVSEKIRHAGALFIGRYSAESLGDYCAGPNHVLPTSGTARFSSPLGVYDFQKRMSIIECSQQGAANIAGVASTLAHEEGLTAHARSAEYRQKS